METSSRAVWAAIVLGGLIAGTIDIGAATLIYWVNPLLVLHSIASGVLGRSSFLEGAWSAVLGLFLQWAMSFLIAAIFVLSSRGLPMLTRLWVASGAAYGIGIFFVMNYVVVPLSRAMPKPHFPHFSPAKFGENLLAMILFGLIVAYFARPEAEKTRTMAGYAS